MSSDVFITTEVTGGTRSSGTACSILIGGGITACVADYGFNTAANKCLPACALTRHSRGIEKSVHVQQPVQVFSDKASFNV